MSRKANILAVDDEPHVLKLIKANLESSGYKVLTAADGAQAVAMVSQELPDLVILDLMLPKMDGYAVCRRIRESSAVPVIMLTARSAEVDLVHGFEVGADDYLTKPFSVTELLMRVQAVLRRSKWPEEIVARQGFKAGPIEIDFAQHRATVDGEGVKLTPTEYRLLAYLASNANRVILHRELLRAVWGPEYGEETEYLRV
jgi:DNA-binding response OmpR family regulator